MSPINVLRLSSLSAAAFVMGCSASAPKELSRARDAYSLATQSETATIAPTELYEARKSLARADSTFVEEGDTAEVRDYAYIAERKVELANVAARTELDRRRITRAAEQGIVVRDAQARQTKAELAATRGELEDARTAGVRQGNELERSTAKLEQETKSRESAEGKLAAAMRDLATVAEVNQEERGVVITLSGTILFASGQHVLLETAKLKLDQVAEALKAQADDKVIVIEGHTDDRGTDAINDPLSLARADAVRDYLVTRGVSRAKVTTVGQGSSDPMVDNSSAENRSNNRRVEIVIKPGPRQVTSR